MAQIACLLSVRDEVVEETRELDTDEPEGDAGTFAMMVASIRSCANER
jgi:hypothetical protein